MNKYTNEYLHITLDGGKVLVSGFDGVFGYSAALEDWQDYERYCDERANDWISYPCANFDSYNKEDREKVAQKWIEAKNLREGSYEYYFNLEDREVCFHNEVVELAKCMGITNKAKEVNVEKILTGFQNRYAHENSGELPSAIEIAKYFFELGLVQKRE